MARILYPQFQAPVLTPAQDKEQVTESRWHQPWSEPVRVAARLLTPNQVAAFLVEAAPFGETVTESRWHQPWSEPVRFLRDPKSSITLASASGSYEGIYTAQIEPGKIEPWFMALSEPVRVPRRLNAALNAFWSGPIAPPTALTILSSQWYAPFSDPVRVPKRLAAAINEFYYGIPQEAIPIITADMPWFAWLSEPVRVPKRLLEALQYDPRFTRFVPPNPPPGVNLPLFTPPQQVNSQGGYYPADLWSGRLNPNG